MSVSKARLSVYFEPPFWVVPSPQSLFLRRTTEYVRFQSEADRVF